MLLPLCYMTVLPERMPLRHSSLRWTIPTGSHCRAGTVLAFCNLGLAWGVDSYLAPLMHEARDLQLAFVLQHPGQVHYARDPAGGGQMDHSVWAHEWVPYNEFGQLETATPPSGPLLRALIVAGRRVSELAEVRDGLLTGWHARKRAWWPDAHDPGIVVAALGSCEVTSIMYGERPGMLDLLDGAAGGSQLLVVPDIAAVPCARTTLEQMRRTEAERQAIAADMASGLLGIAGVLEPRDWLMAGAIQATLLASPLLEPCPMLLRSGLSLPAGPVAVVMSLHAEPVRVFRHRRLGYTLALYDYRLRDLGEGLRQWLVRAFEPVLRSPEDIRADFAALLAALRGGPVRRVLLANMFSSAISDDLPGYAGLDEPLSRTIGTVRAKETNLALASLATEEPNLAILDIDAMAAYLGALRAIPDGMHVAGELQSLVQQDIRSLLAESGLWTLAAF